MGCCNSREKTVTASRASRWRSTGIVAMRDCKLKAFPGEVIDLERSVRTLDLTNNKIVHLPVDISKLVNMQRLIVPDNLIERLPQNIGKLQSLKVLILDGNHISVLPDELGLLVRLEKLSVSGNLLSCLPETIGSLQNIRGGFTRDCCVLHDILSTVQSLLLLNVSNNKLKALPESIGSCYSLEELQANGNSIEELPSSVCSLIHLKSLSMNNNNLQEIPPNLLKECKSLQNISLHDNPISMEQFHLLEGFQDFESRRKKKFDKQIDANVMINSSGLDEGVDL